MLPRSTKGLRGEVYPVGGMLGVGARGRVCGRGVLCLSGRVLVSGRLAEVEELVGSHAER